MNNIRVDTDLSRYLPDWYKPILDYQQIMQTEEVQAEEAYSSLQNVHGNFYFASMDAASVDEWEQILGILPDPENETLEFRRARALNRISLKPPFSIRALKQQLDSLIGSDYRIILDGMHYTIYVEASAENQGYAVEVAYTIESMKPAHIVYINTPLVTSALLMNEGVSSKERQYTYRLGAWGLGLGPFANDGTYEVKKMATTSSIRAEYLNDTAESALANVVSARINGSISKTDLTKARTDNSFTIEYPVNNTDTSLVQKVELLDGDGNVLTSSNVYIPITQNTVMKHIITVQEGVN